MQTHRYTVVMSAVFGLAQGFVPKRVLVVMPTWLGDCVMATPTLRALRGLYPEAAVTALVRQGLEPMLEPCAFVDSVMPTPGADRSTPGGRRENIRRLARRLRSCRFDLAVLMPNSFRMAAVAGLARIPHRVGYARDGRGWLLTDRLFARRERGRFLAMPALEYYLALGRYLGATSPDPTMCLATTAEDERRAAALFREVDVANTLKNSPGQLRRKVVLLNPGAQKPAKRWPAKRFAALADRLTGEHDLTVALTGSPNERDVLDKVIAAADCSILDLPAQGLDLHVLKAVIRRADLLITNDTGPRHMAGAFDTPMVSLFGPTDPRWTQIHFAKERQILAPGQLQTADDSDLPSPRRHMGLIEVDRVYDAACELLGGGDKGKGAEGQRGVR